MAATTTTTTTATNPTTTTTTKASSTRPTQHLPQLSPYPSNPISISHPFHHIYTSQNLPPPNPNPNNSTTTATPNNLPAQQLYPVASSGRGFIHRSLHPQDHNVSAYNPRPALALSYRPLLSPHPDTGLAHLHQLPHRTHPYPYPVHVVRQTQPANSPRPRQHPVAGPGHTRGIPVAAGQVKNAPSPSAVSDSNGYMNSRERSREDNLLQHNVVTVRGRKVRIVDGASLYTLCRSWLRNGQPEESQPDNGDSLKSLPRPLPLAAVEGNLPSTKEVEEEEDEEDEESVDHLSPEDLLKRHIKHAKKVRARLREERLRRIARYKTRLALLLPPQVEQFRNDTAAGD